MSGLQQNEHEGQFRGLREERYYGLPEAEAERLSAIIENSIIRMIQVTDISAREEIRQAWEVISDLGRTQPVNSEHVLQVLRLVGGSAPRIPLLGKVWGIINVCEAFQNLQPEKKELGNTIWSTIREIIATEPDSTNMSQLIMLGASVTGLAYGEDEELRAHRFAEIIENIDKKDSKPQNRWGMQVAASTLARLLDADALRLGVLTVEIRGGDPQDLSEYEGKDLKAGWPDTIMILREGAMHSKHKLKEGVSIGVPTAGDLLVRRPLKVMVGVQRELLDPAATRMKQYPDRRWSFMTPGAYMHSEQPVNWAAGEFVPDGFTLWVALQAIERIKGKIIPPLAIQNEVARAVRKMEERISVQTHDGRIEHAPSILKSAVNEWNENHGGSITFEAASKQLGDSALGLVLAASEPKNDGDYFVSGRPDIFKAYKKQLWESISLEDKLAFVKILYREGSPHRRELSGLSQAVYPLVVDPAVWDEQTLQQQHEIAQAMFESEGSAYGRLISEKQQQMLRAVTGEALARDRYENVRYDVQRVRENVLKRVGEEIVIKAETIRDKAGEPGEANKGETAVIVFHDKDKV